MIVYPSCGMGAATVAGGVVSSIGAATAGLAPIGGPVAPLVFAIAGLEVLAGQLLNAFGVGEGCGPTCVQATQIVNQVEPLLKQNVTLYQSGQEDQPTALNNWGRLWGVVTQGCNAIPGAAGQNCISDRQAGACKPEWKTNGQCWNWDIGYHQPLLVAPINNPAPLDTISGGSASGVVSELTSNPMVLVGLGLLVVGLMVGGK
jgi:hypothetical protein